MKTIISYFIFNLNHSVIIPIFSLMSLYFYHISVLLVGKDKVMTDKKDDKELPDKMTRVRRL